MGGNVEPSLLPTFFLTRYLLETANAEPQPPGICLRRFASTWHLSLQAAGLTVPPALEDKP